MILYILIWAVTWLKKKGTITIKRCNFRINSSTQRKTSKGKMKKKRTDRQHWRWCQPIFISLKFLNLIFLVMFSIFISLSYPQCRLLLLFRFFPLFLCCHKTLRFWTCFWGYIPFHHTRMYACDVFFFRTEKRESIRANETISKILHFILKD